jgi:hypothetical protein
MSSGSCGKASHTFGVRTDLRRRLPALPRVRREVDPLVRQIVPGLSLARAPPPMRLRGHIWRSLYQRPKAGLRCGVLHQ